MYLIRTYSITYRLEIKDTGGMFFLGVYTGISEKRKDYLLFVKRVSKFPMSVYLSAFERA